MIYNFNRYRYIPGLNCIRFLAVSLVLLAHYGFGSVFPGGFGVTVFFFLSGFLITTLLLAEKRSTGQISIFNFYIRRFLRLAPELILMLLVSTIITTYFSSGPRIADIVAALTYTTNYHIVYLQSVSTDGGSHVFWPQLWSLGVEEHFYLVYPLVFVVIANARRSMLAFFTVVFFACLAWRCEVIFSGISSPTWEHAYGYLASETRFDSIAYGAFFAFVAQSNFKLSLNQGRAALALGLILLTITFAVRSDMFRETLRYSIQGVALFMIFTAAYRSEALTALPRIAEWKPLKLGGELSYGAYLWQFEYIRVINYLFPDIPHSGLSLRMLSAFFGFLFCFTLAWISYVYVAKPMVKLRHRFASNKTDAVLVPA